MTAPTTDPGRALVGAVLYLPADAAVRVLGLLHNDDLADPQVRVVAAVARQLAEAGIVPDPAATLAHARATGTVTRADAVKNLALLIGELHGGCPTPASATYYARAVLEDALRRRCAELAVRIAQAAEGESQASLVALVDREVQAVHDVRDRRAIAADDHPARLRAVDI